MEGKSQKSIEIRKRKTFIFIYDRFLLTFLMVLNKLITIDIKRNEQTYFTNKQSID